MSFDVLRGLNGWMVEGSEDLDQLELNPSLFIAKKDNSTLRLSKTTVVDRFEIVSPPSAETPTTSNHQGLAEWRLTWDEYDVARGRSLQDILYKTEKFMKYK
jgi:hypothetical protein